MDGVRAVTFDFCGTLDADGVPWWRRMYTLLACGDSLSLEKYHRVFAQVEVDVQSLFATRRVSLLECVERHLRLQVARLGLRLARPEGVLAGEFVRSVEEGVDHHRKTLELLRAQGKMLGIISNSYGSLADWCSELGLSELIPVCVDSACVGVRKPKSGIFAAASEKLGVAGACVAHVGDNLVTDVRGANRFGFRSVWVQRPGEVAPGDAEKRPSYTVTCVNELA